MKKNQRYTKAKYFRVKIEEPVSVFKYEGEMGGVDWLDQSIRGLYDRSSKQEVTLA